MNSIDENQAGYERDDDDNEVGEAEEADDNN